MSENDRIAHYEILEKIGEGGMGEVFRARDTRLGRIAALKFLPEAFAADPERLARFQREAQVLASLHHPNISAVFGLEEDQGRQVLAMEFVDGEDLAVRTAVGPIPVEEAVDLARQIAEGLEAAHEVGVVHRDLKPANIRVTPDHDVKILDFGLARIDPSSPDSSSIELSQSPTLTGMVTSANVILGTAAFMSPEQARGRPVDKRSDIWAFGAVLYEMLTGMQAFPGDTVSDILAAVLKTEPDFGFLPKGTPPALVDLLRRCLEKDARKRLRDIGEARILLAGDLLPVAAPAPSKAAPVQRNRLLGLLVSLVLLLIPVLAILVFIITRSGVGMRETVYADLLPPPEAPFFGYRSSVAVSPDGRRVLFSLADSLGTSRLYLRDLGDSRAQLIPRTDSAIYPFWGPDGNQIAYAVIRDDRRVLERRDLSTGTTYHVAELDGGFRGGDWSRDGTILFAGTDSGSLTLVSVDGGELRRVTRVRMGEMSHRWPLRLPDGDGFLFTVLGNNTVERGSLSDSTLREVVLDQASNVALADGYLFYAQDSKLLARPMDDAGAFLGNAVSLGATSHARSWGFSAFHAGPGGTVIRYGDETVGFGSFDHGITMAGRDGTEETLSRPGGALDDMSLSDEGRYIALARYDQVGSWGDVWVFDVERRVITRETSAGSTDDPVWGPPGRMIYAQSGELYLHEQGTSTHTLVYEDERDKVPSDWSTDGRYLIYVTGEEKEELWCYDFVDSEARPLLDGPYRHIHGQLSPDNRWLAYSSDESGELQVYVHDFPDMTRRRQVSRASASQPRWSADGKTLVYVDRSLTLHEARLSFSGNGVEVIGEKELFRFKNPSYDYLIRTHQWAMTPDGERFLYFTSSLTTRTVEPFHFILNWKPEQ